MRVRMSSVIVLALAGALAAATLAGAAPPLANFNVTAMPGNEAEDAIAVNPTNPSNVVAMSTLADVPAGLAVGASFNSGRTWARTVIGSTAADPLGEICCDQQLAWDRFGNLWMVYLVNTNTNVPVALSTDGGRTFRKVAEITANGDQPSIAVGPNSVWVSFTDYPGTREKAFGAPVTGLGQFGSFSAPESVPTSNGRGGYGDTAVGPNGQVMVTYQDKQGGQVGSNIYTAVDPDGLGPAGFNTPVFIAHSYVGGFDYIPPQSGRSVDAASWSPAVRLNDDRGTNSQYDPAIALDQSSGALALSWYDTRNDLGAGGSGDTNGVPNDDFQIWATYSTNGGATFAPNFRVSRGTSNAVDANSGFDVGEYTHAAFVGGSFWPAWSDNSNSTGDNPDGTLHQLDLYTAKVSIP